jgi:HlyD family secretion protein
MSKTWKWILIVAGLILVLFFLMRFINGRDKDVARVTAAEVRRCTIVETVNASGKIYPEMEVKVGAGIAGEVTELYVKEGDSVKKGQVLARIITEGRAVPRINMNDLNSLLQGAQGVQSSSPGRVSITAPIGGIISLLAVKKGERVGGMQMAASEFIRIADFSSMEVRVDVNENDIIKVKNGDSADVEVEAYSKRRFRGVVHSIASNTSRRDPASFLSNDITSYEVRIRLDPASYQDLADTSAGNYPFRSGMNARADIKTKTRKDVICVPAGAVASRARGTEESIDQKRKDKKQDDSETTESAAVASDELEEVVFVIDAAGKASRRVVTTGIQDMNHFEILSGLKEGERIVSGPYSAVSRTMRSGNKVRIVSKEELFEN